ncbi:MAG TPA: efflux RND transporter periplasmic adaptor subunit [Woeseiaceae bacterium]|nr:efflux RND transporter periplasmic adaptor subunit [Woeseiaceae bacterium]
MIGRATNGTNLATAFAAAAPLLAACGPDTPSQVSLESATVQVLVEPLQYQSIQTRVEAVGTSRAIRSIELHPATSGEVVSVKFEPGQKVAAGDVLVELDSRQERLAVALAEVRLQDAERLFDRYQRTGSSGAILPTDIDAARTAVEAARIELDRARVALDDRTIEAQFEGHVGITEVDPGDRINPDTLITTLDDRSSLLVTFEVPEARVGDISVGDNVAIASWNSREPTAYGRVVDIGSRIDPVTRTFVARAEVANESDALRPGMSFRVALEVEGTPYPVVAETGVQWGADGAYIWAVVDGRAQRVPVQIVQRQKGTVLVDADVDAGTLIVVEGIQRMRDGIDVSYEPPNVADRHPESLNGATPQGGD